MRLPTLSIIVLSIVSAYTKHIYFHFRKNILLSNRVLSLEQSNKNNDKKEKKVKIYETEDFIEYLHTHYSHLFKNNTNITIYDLEDPFFLMFPWHD
jgi:hypothetical protein